MNKNATPIILLILAIGIYFTYTKGKIEDIKTIKSVNAGYEQAIGNSETLIKVRDEVKKRYNEIDPVDQARLEKLIPNNIDNVRLTLDVKSIGLNRGLVLRNVKTNAPNINTSISGTNTLEKPSTDKTAPKIPNSYDTVTLTFNVSTSYQNFIGLLNDLETSLRIMDISKITLTVNDGGVYDYGVELKTYWLK
jgi:hypothetical protein